MSETQLRDRIIHEATRLFAMRGYARTSVREIVEAAGVTKPTLYHYFGSKGGLFEAVVEHYVGRWAAEMEAAVAGEGPVVGRLRSWMRSAMALVTKSPEVMLFLVRARFATTEGGPEIDFACFHEREFANLFCLIQEGISRGELRDHDIEDSACALIGMMQFRIMGMLEGMPAPPDAADRILNVYLKGVGV